MRVNDCLFASALSQTGNFYRVNSAAHSKIMSPKTTQSFPTNIGRCENIQERWIRRVPTVTRTQVTVGTLIVALKQKPSIITGITLFIIWLIN